VLIGLAGRLQGEAIDFSGFNTPEEVIAQSARSFMAYLGHDLTQGEAEAFASETFMLLDLSGWCLSGLLNREIFALPAAAVERLFRGFAGYDRTFDLD